MAQIRLTKPRPSFRRVMRPQDYTLLGIVYDPLPGAHVWETANKFTVTMDDELGTQLVAKLPKEFFRLDEPAPDEASPPEIPEAAEGAPKSSRRSHRSPVQPEINPDDESAQLSLDVNPVD